jgi:bacteriorhodopsin
MLKDSYYIRSLLWTLFALAGLGGALVGFIYLAGYAVVCVVVAIFLAIFFATYYRPWRSIGRVTTATSIAAKESNQKNVVVSSAEKRATKVKG